MARERMGGMIRLAVGAYAVSTLVLLVGGATFSESALAGDGSFVNWESPHVHPLDRTPDGTQLLAVNTADNRLEVYKVSGTTLEHTASIPTGLDPVSVRARTDNEAWVVNHISDTISIVSLDSHHVVATVGTRDEPTDVVFAGDPERAFVSCSQPSEVLVYDLDDLAAAPEVVAIFGEEPRAMAVSADGSEVYVAIFESGNGSTVLGGNPGVGGTAGAFPPQVVSEPTGPYGGDNPPPNDGLAFQPAQVPGNGTPPEVSHIVRKNTDGLWLDRNGEDWTAFVSGDEAEVSGRPIGWDLPDHDVAVIDADTLALSYIDRVMNLCMAIAVHPRSGDVTLVGTEALNDVRFEPNVSGTFIHVLAGFADPAGRSPPGTTDLNPHLDYTESKVEQSERDKSIGDPRAIIWSSTGEHAYVAGKGSNNVIVIDADGERAGLGDTIEVGEGPTGLALNELSNLLYVLNHFAATISIVDLETETEVEQVALFDPTPDAIRTGRKHLYDTHKNSGLGQIACASCHVDARMDRLAWDLGNPAGDTKGFNQNCLEAIGCDSWHPMKGPMLTQTLQDIIGHEPFHWRGDRDGLEEFNGAFLGLQGDDENLTDDEMQEYEDFLASIHFPPNPFRNFDNSLPEDLPLPGHHTTGRFDPAGDPLPNGNAVDGLADYRTADLDVVECVTCHTLPTGMGRDSAITFTPIPVPPFVSVSLVAVPVGPDGEHHLAVTSADISNGITIKVPHLRNLYERVGFDVTQTENRSGFGYLHDGSVDSIERFVSEPVFAMTSDQQVADMVAFMLAFSGSDLPTGVDVFPFAEPVGPLGQDTHAAVGKQITFDGGNNAEPALLDLYDAMLGLAGAGEVGLVAKGFVDGEARGWVFVDRSAFKSDRDGESIAPEELVDLAAAGSELTFTVVPLSTEIRIGIDRDLDGYYDRDEIDACSDPADPASVPEPGGCGGIELVRGDCNASGGVDISDPIRFLDTMFQGGELYVCDDACDSNDDGLLTIADPIHFLGYLFQNGMAPPAPFPSCGVDPTGDSTGCGAFAPCD